MPTPILNLSSPYENIFGSPPNYSKLRIFSCLCYPWLRSYSSHKLESRSKPCIFLGYSLTQSAYLCYHPPTSRMYVSRHVKFVESVFPSLTLSMPICLSTTRHCLHMDSSHHHSSNQPGFHRDIQPIICSSTSRTTIM